MASEIMLYNGSSPISMKDPSMSLSMAMHQRCYLLLVEFHKVQSLVPYYF